MARFAPLLLALLLLPVGTARAAERCATPAGAKVAAASPEVVLTEVAPSRASKGDTTWVGCLRATGRRTRLARGWVGDKESISLVVASIAGEWVVSTVELYDQAGFVGFLQLTDLRTGFSRSLDAASRGSRDPAPTFAATADRDGRVAWQREQAETSAVRALVAGRVAVLDEGPAGALSDVVLDAGTVRWSSSGAPRSRAVPDTCPARPGERAVLRTNDAVAFAGAVRHEAYLLADGRRVDLGGHAQRRPLVRFAARRDGAVAWIRRAGRVHEVLARDSAGRLLRLGRADGARSLRFDGVALVWRRNGARRTATVS